jgi:hypothetical protein
MKKSGLHKQITSIFDGSPQPCTDEKAAEAPAQCSSAPSVLKRLYGGFDDDTVQPNPAEPAFAKAISKDSAAVKADDAETVSYPGNARVQPKSVSPAVSEGRPMPLPKVRINEKLQRKRISLSEQIKKKCIGDSGADPQQKKMAVLAGGLAVVFGVVLFFSFGGVGSGGGSSKSSTSKSGETIETVSSGPVWKMPEELPDIIRDPMKPVLVATSAESNESSRDFVVKGIVFGQRHSSALINDEIIREGQEFDGIKVVRISKTEVEFEADGQRWTQPVRP